MSQLNKVHPLPQPRADQLTLRISDDAPADAQTSSRSMSKCLSDCLCSETKHCCALTMLLVPWIVAAAVIESEELPRWQYAFPGIVNFFSLICYVDW